MKKFKIFAIWDDEAEVWSVEDSDVPGLVTCAATVEQLHQNCLDLIPELLELNSHLLDEDITDQLSFDIITKRQLKVALCA